MRIYDNAIKFNIKNILPLKKSEQYLDLRCIDMLNVLSKVYFLIF